VASDIMFSGGLDNAATVLVGLAEDGLDLPCLADLSARFPAAAVRRIGWIIEEIGGQDATKLRNAALGRNRTPSLLHPSMPVRGPVCQRWLIRVNSEVEADV